MSNEQLAHLVYIYMSNLKKIEIKNRGQFAMSNPSPNPNTNDNIDNAGLNTASTSQASPSSHHPPPFPTPPSPPLPTRPSILWPSRANQQPPPSTTTSSSSPAQIITSSSFSVTNQEPPPLPNSSSPSPATILKNILPFFRDILKNMLTRLKHSRISFNQETTDHSTSTTFQNILTNLKESRISSNQEFLAALSNCTTTSTILDAVLNLFFTHSPTLTTTATSFLLALSSSDPSTSFDIATHSAEAVISRLRDTLKILHVWMTPPEARVNAAFTLYHLALEPKNKIPIGQTEGLIPALVEYWLDKSVSKRGRRGAGMALMELLTSCEQNVGRLVEQVEKVVFRILELATDQKEGNCFLRRTAFKVMIRIGLTQGRCWELEYAFVMDDMVLMLGEGEVAGWCLEVMWAMCNGGLRGWEFKMLAKRANAEEWLMQEEEWGREGKLLAEEMLKVIRTKLRPKRRFFKVWGDWEEEEEEEDSDW